eukprot:gene29731-37068_t
MAQTCPYCRQQDTAVLEADFFVGLGSLHMEQQMNKGNAVTGLRDATDVGGSDSEEELEDDSAFAAALLRKAGNKPSAATAKDMPEVWTEQPLQRAIRSPRQVIFILESLQRAIRSPRQKEEPASCAEVDAAVVTPVCPPRQPKEIAEKQKEATYHREGTDQEYDRIQAMARASAQPDEECPVCLMELGKDGTQVTRL